MASINDIRTMLKKHKKEITLLLRKTDEPEYTSMTNVRYHLKTFLKNVDKILESIE